VRWIHASRTQVPDQDRTLEVIARNVALAAGFDAVTRQRLAEIATTLIRTKRWEAVGDVDLTDEVLVTIAANAAVPVLALDLQVYRGVQSIIVRPTTDVTSGTRAGRATGVVSDAPMAVIGQATPGTGPLSIAWDAALADSRNPGTGRNVVIHEFAHKIDMSDGYSDGTPPLGGNDLARWTELLADEYERIEPRSSDAVLRAYAWTNPAEFFAVTTEAFFCTPERLHAAKPTLYDALADFYRRDPRGRWSG
jgi:MtfA peptidase